MSKGFRVPVLIATAVASLALCASAQAAPVTLGQTSDASIYECKTSDAYTEIQATSGQTPSYTIPAGGGVITSWSYEANASSTGSLRLKIYRPTANPLVFTVIGESALETIVPNQLDTFPTQIAVQGGDLIGYTRSAETKMDCLFSTTNAGDQVEDAPSVDTAVGKTTSFNSPTGKLRLNISAVLQQPPGISSISPASGLLSGGTAVKIDGHDFTGASLVYFGPVSAPSFTVDSDSQITAIAPPGPTLGKVDIRVTTGAGTTEISPADQFTYTAPTVAPLPFPLPAEVSCTVPKLTGKKLKAAKKGLTKADCKLGKVKKLKGATAKTGKVVKQSPKAGKVLAAGSKVSVKLG